MLIMNEIFSETPILEEVVSTEEVMSTFDTMLRILSQSPGLNESEKKQIKDWINKIKVSVEIEIREKKIHAADMVVLTNLIMRSISTTSVSTGTEIVKPDFIERLFNYIRNMTNIGSIRKM